MLKNQPATRRGGKIVRVLLTGGHAATTAISTLEEILRRQGKKYRYDLYWIGSQRAIEGKRIPTFESQILPKLGIKHYSIITGRVQTRFSLWTIPSLAKIPIGFIHALILLMKVRPEIILSFGGFAAFPVVVIGKIFGAKIILHEQTMGAGRANRYSSFLANRIALARRESLKYFPQSKCVITGNPVMTQIAEINPPQSLGQTPLIYITGGSRGSRFINELIKKCLNTLLARFYLIHQTGSQDYNEMLEIKNSLPEDLRKNYEIYSLIDPMQVDGVFKRADLIISRAGANTVSDIIASFRPAILIPLPKTYMDEQTKNANYAFDIGIVKVVRQEDVSPSLLMKVINQILKDRQSMINKVKNFINPDIYASKKLVDLIEEELDEI